MRFPQVKQYRKKCQAYFSHGVICSFCNPATAYTVFNFYWGQIGKIGGKWCLTDKYGAYESLNDAISACGDDPTCGYVYDQKCDNHDSFRLCKRSATISDSAVGSCIYKDGM